jgi:hypothetical protein
MDPELHIEDLPSPILLIVPTMSKLKDILGPSFIIASAHFMKFDAFITHGPRARHMFQCPHTLRTFFSIYDNRPTHAYVCTHATYLLNSERRNFEKQIHNF